MEEKTLFGRETSGDTCLYGSVVGLDAIKSRQGNPLAMELMDDSDEDAEFLSYPPTLSPVEWTLNPVPPGSLTGERTPREKLRLRRRSRSDSSTPTDTTDPRSICDECEIPSVCATVHCHDCDLKYCAPCDDARHRKGKLVFHRRVAMDTPPAPTSAAPVAPLTPPQWSTKDVADWLAKLDLQIYEGAFEKKKIDGAALIALLPHELDAMDEEVQASRGHKKKLQREIQKIKDEHPSKHNQLRVNVDTASLQRRRSDMTSPVAALRAKIHQGQSEKGRVVNNGRRATVGPFVKPVLDIATEATHAPRPPPEISTFNKRRPVSGLGLDLNQVEEKSLKASFDFTAEGRLQSHGFEINTDGITSTPFQTGQVKALFGTKDSLVILNELGHGASGKVYKALYLPTFKLVAVKVIRVYDQKKRHQMLRELKSLCSNFVSLKDTGKAAACQDLVMFYDAYTNPEIGSVSIVLEYMDGGSLEDFLRPGTRCSEDTIATIATSVLKGLSFLHETHQLHRDIKLSNILVNKAGRVKISDFGISRDLESTLAEAATFTGTLLYMAPERISGGTYSYPSDIWSFGLALMACAIGKLPVPTEDGYWGVVHAVQEQPSPRLRDYGDFSPELCDFLDQCLMKDPLNRPPAYVLLSHPFIQKHIASSPEFPTKSASSDSLNELNRIAEKVREWMSTHDRSLLATLMDNSSTRAKALAALAGQMQLTYEAVEQVFSFF
ncbi:Aste57867_23362 [Aphanomyces stellatus]|uniref:mitogen-activated protein kinase kinase n=1 Tax=Aphanomyces stellatus TaxID=120398 RepID=A0A485LS37_9STRA|nr:hypothetical protein As57867_023291 [Aphanomyces stellatus]VFU00008.1 Aste57867_23362 [Aphanomyces stellatus]